MEKVAAELSDIFVVTRENRNEYPEDRVREVVFAGNEFGSAISQPEMPAFTYVLSVWRHGKCISEYEYTWERWELVGGKSYGMFA